MGSSPTHADPTAVGNLYGMVVDEQPSPRCVLIPLLPSLLPAGLLLLLLVLGLVHALLAVSVDRLPTCTCTADLCLNPPTAAGTGAATPKRKFRKWPFAEVSYLGLFCEVGRERAGSAHDSGCVYSCMCMIHGDALWYV